MDYSWLNDKYVDKLTEPQAKFIFEQAEKYLKEVSDSNTLLVTRTTTLITITVGFMLALIGFMSNRLATTKDIFDNQLLTSAFTLCYIYWLCRLLVKNIQPNDYHITGAEPKKLFIDKFFAKDVSPKERMKCFYVNEFAVCQKKIEENVETNNIRWGLYNKTLRGLQLTPVAIIIAYILAEIVVMLRLLFFLLRWSTI